MVDWQQIRDDFPVTRHQIYFISAGMSPIPTPVFNKIVEEYQKVNEYGDIFWEDDVVAYAQLREKIGAMINAPATDLAFLQNTSTAMSILALSLKNAHPNNFNIISMEDEFPSTTVPFEYQNIPVKYIKPIHARYEIDRVLDEIDNETVAVVTSYVQYCTGFRQDLVKLGEKLKKRGILFIVNATQGYPLFPIDVEEMKIDALTASLHKWGYTGHVGTIFYTSSDFRKRFKTPIAGWLSVVPDEGDIIFTKKNHPITLLDSADQYIQGCINLQSVKAFGTALDYLHRIGIENIRDKLFELTNYCIEGLKKIGTDIISPIRDQSERSAIISFRLGEKNKELVSFLEGHKVYTSYRNGNVRVSLNFFNTTDELDTLFELTQQFLRT